MAKASRSSKKQPAFDPSELSDLIFSPAVGTGVGSHLLENVPDVSTVVEIVQSTEAGLDVVDTSPDMSTVDSNETATVPKAESATVDMSNEETTVPVIDWTTVVESNQSTVVGSTSRLPTVVQPDLSTVAPAKFRRIIFWITDNGDLVPQGRVKRISIAQDVINSAEESVYDTLWTARPVQTGNRESSRVVQAGYDYLGKKTRLSKKTIQRIVAKLIDKDFIAIERPADIYQRTSTVYRVFSYKAVLERHARKGRTHVAKMGPGFSYVRPLSDPRPNLSTVPELDEATVAEPVRSTADSLTTRTVAPADPSTVVRESTILIGSDVLGTPASSAIHQALYGYGAVDDDAVRRLVQNCRQQAPDCTEEEIVHFIGEKGALVRVRDTRIHSPVGFLLTAVPKCFSGEAFRLYRQETARQREAQEAAEARRRAEVEEWGREQERLLADPTVSEEDKLFIRQCLGMTS
jgi:predicted transcriptional regulator